MVKIKIVSTGLLREVEGKTICFNKGRQMRIIDAKIGDLVFLTSPNQSKETVVEVLGEDIKNPNY